MNENTPVEILVESTADEASNGLERIVDVLNRMEASITGIASSLSNFKANTQAVAKSFEKLKASSRMSFDTTSLRKSTEMMERYRDLAKKMSKSDNVTHRADGKSMTAAIREAELHMRAMKDLDPGTDKYKKHEQALIRCKNQLGEYRRSYQKFQAEQASAAKAAEASRIAAVETQLKNITYVDNTVPQPENEGHYVQQTVELGKGVGYDIEDIARQIEEANGPAKELQERIEAIAKIKIKSPEDLAKAFEAQKRFDRAAQTKKDNVVKFTAVGDTKRAVKEAEKLTANEAAVKAFEAAINSADEAWKRLASGEEISITNPEEYLEAEKNLKKLNNEVHRYSAELRRAKAAGDAVGAGKAQLKLDGAIAEQSRYTAALGNASQIRADMEAAEQLEDSYKKIEKLRSQISSKEIMGKNAFNSPALRKLKLDLTDAEMEAVRLKRALGELSGGKALAQNMRLVATRTLQSYINMKMLDKEAKKANRSLVQMSRVLQLMAVRMGVRYVLKDLKAGFVALAQGYEPFNDAMSNMMDASTQLRNNVVSAFQPLINAVAPAAINAINGIANVVERVAQAMAAMTGQSYYVKLTSEAQDFAKANEEAKNSLAGFDKFNLLGDGGKASNGENFKTTVEEVPVPENMKKWKHIGDGIKAVFKGIGAVIDSIVKKFRKWFDIADDEDVFEWIGGKLTAAGEWIEKNADTIGNWVIGLTAAKVVLNGLVGGFMKIYGVYKTLKGVKNLFGAGKTAKTVAGAAGASGATGSLLTKAASGFKKAVSGAGTFLKAKLTSAGTWMATKATAAGAALKAAGTAFKTKAVAAAPAIAGAAKVALPMAAGTAGALYGFAGSYGAQDKLKEQVANGDLLGAAWTGIKGIWEGPKSIAADISQLGKDLKEYGKERTGEDVSTLSSLGVLFGDKIRSMFGMEKRDYNERPINAVRPPQYNAPQTGYLNTTAPSLTGNVAGKTASSTANQSAITTAVASGVEKAVTRAMTGMSHDTNVTVKVEGDLNKLFKFIVQQNNAQFNRSGRSPLKV